MPRHPWNSQFCELIGTAMSGRAAAELKPQLRSSRSCMGIAVLPTWAWVVPRTPMGKKGFDRASGEPLSFPVRIDWPQSVIIVKRSETVKVDWTADGLGTRLSGSIHVSASVDTYDNWESGRYRHPDQPTDLDVPLLSYGMVMSRLSRLIEQGTQAQWEVINHLRTYVEALAAKARRSVTSELCGETENPFVPQVLDDIGLESVVDSLVYGRPGGPQSRVSSLVERCMQQGTFKKVDPLKYVSITLRRDAEEEVRRAIGDPHIGPKVRSLFSTGRHSTYEEFVADYNRAYPSDDLGPLRTASAIGARLFPSGVAMPSEFIESVAEPSC